MAQKKIPRDFFSLRQVVEITGISEYTLRGWELRHGAFRPMRSATGRRRYSRADLEKAAFLQDLVQRGRRIGEIAGWENERLKEALAQDQNESPSLDLEISAEASEIASVIARVESFDWLQIESMVGRLRRRWEPSRFLEGFVLPFFRQVGILVHQRRLNIAQEHLISALLKDQLQALRLSVPKRKKNSSDLFLLATPEGDHHDMGLMVAATMLALRGRSYLLLGPHVPKKDLCEAAVLCGATHVLLSSTISKEQGAAEDIYSYVNGLDRHLPAKIQIWVGGLKAANLQISEQGRVRALASLGEFDRLIAMRVPTKR